MKTVIIKNYDAFMALVNYDHSLGTIITNKDNSPLVEAMYIATQTSYKRFITSEARLKSSGIQYEIA